MTSIVRINRYLLDILSKILTFPAADSFRNLPRSDLGAPLAQKVYCDRSFFVLKRDLIASDVAIIHPCGRASHTERIDSISAFKSSV